MVTAILLVLIGLGFILAEIFFPSLGVLGLCAAGCIVGADLIAFSAGNTLGWSFIVAEVILVPLVVWGAFRWLPHTGIGKRMVLSGPVTPDSHGTPPLAHLVGQQGLTLTTLRPSGLARLGDDRISVVGQGGMIGKGRRIVVLSVEGTEVKVREIETETAPDQSEGDA